MAGNHKIKAKQIDIESIVEIFDNEYVRQVEVDVELSKESERPIANKVVASVIETVVTEVIEKKADYTKVEELENKFDSLDDDISEKADVNNPTFTGTVTLPAIGSETGDDLKAATVGFVNEQIAANMNAIVIDGGEI